MTNEVDFSSLVEKHGHPIATSNNGQIFIFKKSKEQLDDLLENTGLNTPEEVLESEFSKVSIIKMTIDGMTH